MPPRCTYFMSDPQPTSSLLLSRQQVILLILLTLMWGVNWPIMKMCLRELSPLYFRALTMTGGCLFMTVWLALHHVSLKISLSDFLRIFFVSAPNVFGWHMLSIYGVKELASGRAAILGFTMPIWTAFLGALFLRQRLTGRLWISIMAGGAAVALLSFNELRSISGNPIGIIWMQLAAICWAIGILLFARLHLGVPVQTITVWMFGIGACFFWIIAPIMEPVPSFDFSGTMWAALLYSMLINFGVAQLIWFSLASKLPPAASAFSIMAVPLVGIFSAMPLVGETPHATDFIAAGCIMIAIASAVWRKTPKPLRK